MILYPLRFEPIYQYRLWGGRRLATLLPEPLPNGGLVGEAWILSDRADHRSRVADGPLKGWTLGQLMDSAQDQLMGKLAWRFLRFPLLLKFLDALEMLSVQVHPAVGVYANTEAWVVLEAKKESCIYAGLKPHTTPEALRESIESGTVPDNLISIDPKPGDGVFIPAGTVHSLGGDVVVFEIQQNSDTTFRLYDWDHLDADTGKPRPLQIDQALAAIDFDGSKAGLVVAVEEALYPVERKRLFDCPHFSVWTLDGREEFTVGAEEMPRVLVCTAGSGQIEHAGISYPVGRGDVWLLPAVVGKSKFRPSGLVALLEIAIPSQTYQERAPHAWSA
jgi:mannose-6-phosphate isomerase